MFQFILRSWIVEVGIQFIWSDHISTFVTMVIFQEIWEIFCKARTRKNVDVSEENILSPASLSSHISQMLLWQMILFSIFFKFRWIETEIKIFKVVLQLSLLLVNNYIENRVINYVLKKYLFFNISFVCWQEATPETNFKVSFLASIISWTSILSKFSIGVKKWKVTRFFISE